MIIYRDKMLTPKKLIRVSIIFASIWLVSLLVCSLFGQSSINWRIWWSLRMPRLVTASLVGAALATGGISLQSILRNPLAEPYLLGISTGAGVGLLLGMLISSLGASALVMFLGTPGLAFIGAGITCLLVYMLSQRSGKLDCYSLILAGVIINSINSAIMLLIHLYMSQVQVANFASWMMGSITELGWTGTILFCGILILASWGWLIYRSAHYNLLMLGDQVAQTAGVEVFRLRAETFIAVSVSAACAVALAGPIGFIGLIVPHITRRILKYDCRIQIVAIGFIGATFLLVAQTVCSAFAPYLLQNAHIPVGIVTALTGGPFFLFLLIRSHRRENV